MYLAYNHQVLELSLGAESSFLLIVRSPLVGERQVTISHDGATMNEKETVA